MKRLILLALLVGNAPFIISQCSSEITPGDTIGDVKNKLACFAAENAKLKQELARRSVASGQIGHNANKHVPSASESGNEPKSEAPGRELLTEIRAFSEARPSPGATYGWSQYVDDANRLHDFGKQFHDILPPRMDPTYEDVRAVYAALDEAADELSERGRRMHSSSVHDDGTYDRHLFVGPGWFRLYVQDLRRVHEQQTKLNETQAGNFKQEIDFWKTCQSGIEPGQNCDNHAPSVE
jgi:hypothetical protein